MTTSSTKQRQVLRFNVEKATNRKAYVHAQKRLASYDKFMKELARRRLAGI